MEELEYKYKWDEMVKDLKNTLKKFNIPEGVECGTGADITIPKPSKERRSTIKRKKGKK